MKTIVKYNPGASGLVDWGFDSFLDSFDRIFSEPIFALDGRAPKVDVREEEGKYTLEADLPGLTEKDIEVKVDGNLLTISSAKKEEKEDKKDDYLIKERRAYAFARSFTLPNDVAKDKIEAHFKNGLLSLVLPKSPEAQPKQIEIKSN